jgi:dihydroflavonol-4-reductase
MRTVVIGAAGHIGNAITRALLQRKYKVTACGRRKKLPVNLARLSVDYVSGDARSAGQFDRWIRGHDIVIDAAAPYPLEVYSVAHTHRDDPLLSAERRTRELLKAVSNHDASLIYIGSFVTMARPQTDGHRMWERMFKLAHPYFQVKELIESQILDARRFGIRAAIVNPSTCYGPWDLRDRSLCTVPLVLSREIPSTITQKLNVVDVRDVALAVLKLIDQERYGSPLFVGGHDLSVRELYSLICQIGGVPAPAYSTDARLAMLGTYWMELAFSAIGREPPLLAGGMMMAAAFDYDLPASALAELGVVPRALAETIADSIKWYRKIGYC